MYPSFLDELEKISSMHGLAIPLGAAMGGLAAAGALFGALPPGTKKRMREEVHDPRLYSNLRGALTGESAQERIKAHAQLRRGKHSVLSAAREGFTRGGHRKEAFATNAFSGPMNPTFFRMASHLPPSKIPIAQASHAPVPVPGHGFEPTRGGFLLASGVQGQPVRPLPKVAALKKRPKEKDGEMLQGYYPYKPGDFKPAKLAFSPAAALATSKRVGTAPNALGRRGLSIAETAKPFGFGRAGAIAGTDKAGKV